MSWLIMSYRASGGGVTVSDVSMKAVKILHRFNLRMVEVKLTQAVITNIQGYSLHDGPGIRTVVFFKGCSLVCKWCANPECISREKEIGFIKNLCAHCGKCFSVCPEKALNSDESKPKIDYSRCRACGTCVESCYYKAMVCYGREMTVEEVFDAVRRDKMFYDTSGGGVTVSGGEPLLDAPFVKALFELCKNNGINTCIETCGFVNPSSLLSVLPFTDNVLYDIKHLNSDSHKDYTGQFNELILENAKLAVNSKVKILFRMPLIPTINDDEENIKNTASFLKSICLEPEIQLMPYHRMGESKYKALNKKIPILLRNVQIMGNDRLEEVNLAFINYGIKCSISR